LRDRRGKTGREVGKKRGMSREPESIKMFEGKQGEAGWAHCDQHGNELKITGGDQR